MTSFWHLTAVCCIPIPNPKARFREEEIFCQVAPDQAKHAHSSSNGRSQSCWVGNEGRKAKKCT
jgi:hypothetical protein